MLMIDVLLKAAEYVEQQEHLQQYNDATSSSSSSSSSSSDISINNNTINSNISNLSTSGYSSGGSNSSTSTVTLTPSLASRFLPIIENQKTKFTNISNITHQDVSSNKRVNYSQNNNKTLSSSNLPTTSSNATAALNNVNTNQRLIKSEYTNGRNSMPFNSGRSSKYQQNMSILRLEEIKRDKAIHNTLEKNRRAHLKECFENLQNELPQYRDKKVTNLAILNYTLKYIQQLTKREKDYEHEKLRLERRQARLNNNFTTLANELQKDNIDYNSFIIDSINDDETSTSTASEIEAHYQTSDNNLDDEFDDNYDGLNLKKRKLSRSSMSIGDDYIDDCYDDLDDSDDDDNNLNDNEEDDDVGTDDAYDYLSSSDNNAKIEFMNNLKRQKRFTRKRNKYTNESTDSISSDITVENYNFDRKLVLTSKIHDFNKNKQIDTIQPQNSKLGITQVTSSPPPPQAPQQTPNSKIYFSQNTILHKALNEKFQINTKLINNNNNSISSCNNSCSSNDSNYESNKLQYISSSNPITTTIISATNSLSPFCGMFSNTNEIKPELIDHSQQHQTNNKITKRTRSSRPATVNQLLSNHVTQTTTTTPTPSLTTTTTTATTTVKHVTPITKLTTTNEHPTITIVNNNQNSNNNNNNENENNANINNIKVIKCNKPTNVDGGSHISTILIKHQPNNNMNLYVPSTTPQQQQHQQSGIETSSSSPIIRNCLKSSQFITNSNNTTTILKPLIINSSVNQQHQQTLATTTTIITPTVSKSVQIINKTATTPKLADL